MQRDYTNAKARICAALVLANLLILFPGFTAAEITASISLTTDYVYRGYSKTEQHPTVQGGVEYVHDSGPFIGLWGSGVDFGDDRHFDDTANFELSPYLGLGRTLGTNWYGDLTFTRYLYDGDVYGQDYDYNELYFSLHYQDWISVAIAYSNDAYATDETGLAYELHGRYGILDGLVASAGVGYNDAEDALGEDYAYWNVGMGMSIGNLTLDVRYHGTETDRGTILGALTDSGLVLTLSVTGKR